MRVSSQKERTNSKTLASPRKAFAPKNVLQHERSVIYVGLIGGNDLGSIAVRQAQSVLRFDRRPSFFSHAFLFSGKGEEILECRVVDADPGQPENNGVWRSSAEDYYDVDFFPNRALITFRFKSQTKRRSDILARATNPNISVERIDLWSLVAEWQPYIFDPFRHQNPLLRGLSHPGAAYVNWALDAGGIDVTLGASEPTDAPEHIWAAANWWSEAFATEDFDIEISIHSDIKHPDCRYPDPQSM